MKPSPPVSLAVVGAGLRSQVYARYATEAGLAKVVAVADPDRQRRDGFARAHGIAAGHTFTDWRELAGAGRLADGVIIGTRDALHAEPAVAFADLGYHVLLEKPMATTEADAERIARSAERAGVMLSVCHVMRYTAYTAALKSLLDSDRVGTVVNVQHLEPVAWWHQAHSYVRGHSRRADESASMLMTKSIHDIDWLMYLLDRPVRRVSSFGSLMHFRPQNRPAGAADRCVACAIERTCPYSAPRLYLRYANDDGAQFWPAADLRCDGTAAGIRQALAAGPYGRCVYAADNDVVDHQVVNLELADGATVGFTMTGFSAGGGRRTRFFGTRGSIDADGQVLTVHDFTTDTQTVIDPNDPAVVGAHGGGDRAVVNAFCLAVATGDRSLILSDAQASLASHKLVWAAERARCGGGVVSLA